MAEHVKVPYEGGLADAEQLEMPFPGPFSKEFEAEGGTFKMEMNVNGFFRLVSKTDEEGEPIYVFNVQVKVSKVPKLDNAVSTQE